MFELPLANAALALGAGVAVYFYPLIAGWLSGALDSQPALPEPFLLPVALEQQPESLPVAAPEVAFDQAGLSCLLALARHYRARGMTETEIDELLVPHLKLLVPR